MRAIELVTDRGTKEPLGGDGDERDRRRGLRTVSIVLTAGTYGNVVRLLPPLTIEDGLLAEGCRSAGGSGRSDGGMSRTGSILHRPSEGRRRPRIRPYCFVGL